MSGTLESARALGGDADTRRESFLSSSVGRKAIMAVTGVVFFGFVLGHMSGNLLVFMGPDAMNAYGAYLHHALHGGAIWVARILLLGSLGLHVWASVTLTLSNRAARPVAYKKVTHDASTYASRTMIWSGPLILIFVVYHLLDLTYGTTNPRFVPGSPYENVVASFHRPLVTGFYLLAMSALALHLRHGVWSMLQSLGVSHPRYDSWRKHAATLFALVVAIGFMAVPVAVLAGIVR